MVILKERIALMTRLGAFLLSNDEEWQEVKHTAFRQNPWFLPKYIDFAIKGIVEKFLQNDDLQAWIQPYSNFHNEEIRPTVGLIMAGNIPLVGFHDFLSIFLSGCRQRIKLSSKDTILWHFLIKKLKEWNPEIEDYVAFSDQLKGCDAYIATGSNNSSRYFEYYFAKYPHIIRKNRSSLAVLTGNESTQELAGLADDICLYFGMGCRNITQLFVPENYDFQPLIKELERYSTHLSEPKYKNNYDYQLALILLNKLSYMEAGPVLLTPSDSLFAPIGVVHYKIYKNSEELKKALPTEEETQCCVGTTIEGMDDQVNFGTTQQPGLTHYPDHINTLSFLNNIKIMKKTNA